MEGVSGVSMRGAPSQSEVAQGFARHMERVRGLGKRCQDEGCLKSAIGGTGHCEAHGGGRHMEVST